MSVMNKMIKAQNKMKLGKPVQWWGVTQGVKFALPVLTLIIRLKGCGTCI